MASVQFTWLITGASSGLGFELAVRALSKGDRVIATSRLTSRLDHVKAKGAAVLALDQNQSFEHVQSAIKAALEIYHGVDIVVNNAACAQIVQGNSAKFQASVFGPLNVYRAILPHFREKRSGLLATIGSMAAWYPTPGCTLYNSSKAALRGIGLGLQSEVAGFGIKHCLIEPGAFRTELVNPAANMTKSSEKNRLADYAEPDATNDQNLHKVHDNQLGDPVKGAEIVYDVLTSSSVASGRDIPPFLPLGSDAVTGNQTDSGMGRYQRFV